MRHDQHIGRIYQIMKNLNYDMYGLKRIQQYRVQFWVILFKTHCVVYNLRFLRDRLNVHFSRCGYTVTTVRREPYLSRKGVSITVVIA